MPSKVRQKAPRQSGKVTQEKMLHASVLLFLENGYQKTTVAQISKLAGMTSSAFFRAFPDKESVLYALVSHMFTRQFAVAETLLGGKSDPLLLYGMETALQLHITEQSEALRDVYVMAYSLPTTSEYIYQRTAERLMELFSPWLPRATGQDFYELEIASGSITRGYMAKKCDLYFPLDQKIRRFLTTCLKLYDIPSPLIDQIITAVSSVDLREIAQRVVEETVKVAEQGFFTTPAAMGQPSGFL